MNRLVGIWFTQEQLQDMQSALNVYRHDCSPAERLKIDPIIDHIDHFLDVENRLHKHTPVDHAQD